MNVTKELLREMNYWPGMWGKSLGCALIWGRSPQGYDHWADRYFRGVPLSPEDIAFFEECDRVAGEPE